MSAHLNLILSLLILIGMVVTTVLERRWANLVRERVNTLQATVVAHQKWIADFEKLCCEELPKIVKAMQDQPGQVQENVSSDKPVDFEKAKDPFR